MNLPILEPIVWKRKKQQQVVINRLSIMVRYVPVPGKPDVKHNYIGEGGILYIHMPGLPEI